MAIRVLVNGAHGKMGQAVVLAIKNTPALSLVGEADQGADLSQLIHATQAQVVVDFTTALVAFDNAATIIAANACPVIGTTGISAAQLKVLSERCKEKKLGGLVAPNFSIGALLMMRYAEQCAHYFSDVEIIELHHNKKVDAPSGTAMRTAEKISAVQNTFNLQNPDEKEILPGARGARHKDIPIHSVRLPALLAHQEVLFSGAGETLTIRHDTYSREAFMPGVVLACKKVVELDHLVYGLEHLLF